MGTTGVGRCSAHLDLAAATYQRTNCRCSGQQERYMSTIAISSALSSRWFAFFLRSDKVMLLEGPPDADQYRFPHPVVRLVPDAANFEEFFLVVGGVQKLPGLELKLPRDFFQ